MPAPTKFTKQIQENICTAIRNGCTYSLAAAAGGITRQTLYTWIDERPDFALALEEADKFFADRLLKVILEAIENKDGPDGKLAMELLGRRQREGYGRADVAVTLQAAPAASTLDDLPIDNRVALLERRAAQLKSSANLVAIAAQSGDQDE